MTEQIITFETAKLAKEKGYINGTIIRWCDNVEGMVPVLETRAKSLYTPFFENNKEVCHEYEAPTQSMLQKWLREVHNIHIEISFTNDRKYIGFVHDEYFTTYEEALEAALIHALNAIK